MKPNYGFAFALASAGFLWEGAFRSLEIASDLARYQEFMIFPWGGNSIRNPLFRSASFALETSQLNVTRSEKMAAIAKNEIALRAATFCADHSARPHNCGVCPKCIRTKAMFLASIKKLPDIFLDGSWKPEFLERINLNTKAGLVVFMDFYMEAVKNGTQENVPGMVEKFNDFFFPSRMTRFRRALKISKP